QAGGRLDPDPEHTRQRRLAADSAGEGAGDGDRLAVPDLAERPGDRDVGVADDLDLAVEQAPDPAAQAHLRGLVAAQEAEAVGVVHGEGPLGVGWLASPDYCPKRGGVVASAGPHGPPERAH